ncbi:conserved hypothetical protein [Desulforapulum autotrophicum HRM2]|uniref:DUF2241 domain-containing protein n=1 Tax=Desulforapulum autotrophicum (strain ATCC 43914 / DSM 3382 / VKM B-1955 / HRM2) TaxID=177437 RepID=C0QDH0_DESAH|nr:ACT domain-containing protein [Desulforapulum autotrophicum]ACN15234.1 conserved hypothetical protein [Desulforapulum autotrophicum HRM2]
MAGITELDTLLNSMRPRLMDGEFVFCTVPGALSNYLELEPLATVQESEGVTLVLNKDSATKAGLVFEGVYRQITLTVHSSLDAVGLTAAVSSRLASRGISANVIAAYYHDHIFVQKEKADSAMAALETFAQ